MWYLLRQSISAWSVWELAKRNPRHLDRFRHSIQIGFSALTNGYLIGFVKGKIYTGPTKKLCLPGLNCYSCPGALGSCPIGALQSVLNNRKFSFAFYVVGFLMLIGVLAGRLVCGFLCPFGLLQDLLHKIPFIKKWDRLPGDRFLRYLKYLILLLFVILLPLFAVDIVGQGSPWFCKYICPSGTLGGGIPLVLADSYLQSAIGMLYTWKLALLFLLLLLSILIYRPFCKYLCPLGAIYGLFNKISLNRYQVDPEKCTSCQACVRTCKMNVEVYKNPNSAECIRCGNCKTICPTGAITSGSDRVYSHIKSKRGTAL